jgi:hypothetical protein
VLFGEPGRRGGGGFEVGVDPVESAAREQHQRGIDDVLAGGTAMDGSAGVRRHEAAERPDERRHRIAGQRRLPADLGQVDVARGRLRRDGRAGTCGRAPGSFQRPGQSGLGIQHRLEPVDVTSSGSAPVKQAAEQLATRGGCHPTMIASAPSRCIEWAVKRRGGIRALAALSTPVGHPARTSPCRAHIVSIVFIYEN